MDGVKSVGMMVEGYCESTRKRGIENEGVFMKGRERKREIASQKSIQFAGNQLVKI